MLPGRCGGEKQKLELIGNQLMQEEKILWMLWDPPLWQNSVSSFVIVLCEHGDRVVWFPGMQMWYEA